MTKNESAAVPERQLMADLSADAVGRFLVDFQSDTGVPTDLLLAGAHAQLIGMMVTYLGGEITADTCIRAASAIRNLPSLEESALAAAQPAGRA